MFAIPAETSTAGGTHIRETGWAADFGCVSDGCGADARPRLYAGGVGFGVRDAGRAARADYGAGGGVSPGGAAERCGDDFLCEGRARQRGAPRVCLDAAVFLSV